MTGQYLQRRGRRLALRFNRGAGDVVQLASAAAPGAGKGTILDGPVDRRTTSPDRLEAPATASPEHEACRRELDAVVAGALDAVQAQLDAGEVIAARDALVALDDRYGGLAAPRSLELARAIEASLAAAQR